MRGPEDFAIWYTPGVAAPCRDIAAHPERVFDHTNRGNLVAIVSDGTRVLGLGDIGPEAGLPGWPWDAQQADARIAAPSGMTPYGGGAAGTSLACGFPIIEVAPMRRAFALFFGFAFLACATSNEPKVSREETEVTRFRARVEAIDHATRVVTLVDEAGSRATFRADEAVKNLPQVEVGDQLVGEMMESLAVEVRPATEEEKAAPASIAELAATAEPGQKPAGLFVRQAKALYTIESIDKTAGGGTLLDSEGDSHFVKVRDPAVLDRVKVGDTVVVTLTEALRIEVLAP